MTARATPRWLRFTIGASAPLLLAVIVYASTLRTGHSDRPNVILLLVDTLRADHLSHYGYGRATAAGLDEFANQATVFTRCYSPEPWTAPSSGSIHTGHFPTSHGVRKSGDKLDASNTTLAEYLQREAWHTVGHSFNHHVSSHTGFDQGFDVFDDFLGDATTYPDISRMLQRVTRWFQDRPHGPFFLYLHPMNVHGPYKVPAARQNALLGRPPSREFTYYGPEMKGIMFKGRLELRDTLTPGYLRSLVDQYDTAIRYTLEELGQVLQMLKRQGEYDNSLIIVTADHGEELFDHGGFSHGYTLHRELLHVPLYIKLPHQARGQRVDTAVSLMDIVPTALDVLGIEADRTLEGRSLLPLLDGGGEETLIREQFLYLVDWKSRCQGRALLRDGHKLIEIQRNYEGRRGATLLYDVQADPNEQHDLASQQPERVQHMRRALRQALDGLSDTAVQADNVLDELDRARLKALGYAQ